MFPLAAGGGDAQLPSAPSYRGCPTLGTAGHVTAAPCPSLPPALVGNEERKKPQISKAWRLTRKGAYREDGAAKQRTNPPMPREPCVVPVLVQPETNLVPPPARVGLDPTAMEMAAKSLVKQQEATGGINLCGRLPSAAGWDVCKQSFISPSSSAVSPYPFSDGSLKPCSRFWLTHGSC